MKVLIVCSGNSTETLKIEDQQPFVFEQAKSLMGKGVETDFFLISGNGFVGYLKNLSVLRKKINMGKYDLIHAHFGLSGMLATLQRKCPVVITFQGCDINRNDLRIISKIAMKISKHSIFVSKKLAKKIKAKKSYSILPYGVDLKNTFIPMDKNKCRKVLEWKLADKIALFSSSFDRSEKNYSLAKKAMNKVGNIKIIELLNGYSRDEINSFLNACDFLILTSIREGSPQIIKEALACNCPIISTDVGDVKAIIGNTEGCYITSFEPDDVANKMKLALKYGKRTDGRKRVAHLSVENIAGRIITIYKELLAGK